MVQPLQLAPGFRPGLRGGGCAGAAALAHPLHTPYQAWCGDGSPSHSPVGAGAAGVWMTFAVPGGRPWLIPHNQVTAVLGAGSLFDAMHTLRTSTAHVDRPGPC